MAKKLNKYNRVAGYLLHIFTLLNEQIFNNELPTPTVTIQSTPEAYAHISVSDHAWTSDIGSTYELNVGAGTLSRDICEVTASICHEASHLWAMVHGIKDTSNGYRYHNRKFKEIAEAHGLIIEHHPTYGWTITSPSEELIDFCIRNDLTDILLNRNEGYSFGTGTPTPTGTNGTNNAPGSAPRKSSYRRYVCPCCGLIIRATKVVRVKCIDCDTELIEQN